MAAPCRRLPVVVVLGATGTGKSKLAIELAKVFSGEIINADSMQVYKGLDIITNKVTKEERAECPHHLLDHVSPLNLKYTISDFQAASIPLIDSLLNTGKLPVVVGGTHYYIESLLWKFLINQQDLPEHVAQEDDSSHRKVTERVAGSMGEKDQEMSEDIGTDLVPPHPDLTEDSPVTKRRRISSKQDDHQVISVSDTNTSGLLHKPQRDSSTITFESPKVITEKPTTDVSTITEKPTTDVSTITEKPTTDVPIITEKPTTDASTITLKPTTDVSTITEKPTTDVSTITEKPTTDVSAITEKPTTDVPTITEKPTTDVPTITEKPTTDVSTITEKPTTDVSTITEKPTTDASTTEKPTTDVPTMIHSSFIDNKVELVKTEGEDGTCDQMESLAPDSLIGDNTTDEDIDVEDISRYPLKDIRQWGYHVVPAQLHARLKRLDPASAMKIHPNDYRKIIRTLEIYEKHGIAKSEILKEQHKLVGSDALSGPLRYLKCCIFWVQCDQEVLNKRLDDRVDGMLARGLVKEMLDFHKQYNESRFKEERESDYSLGIFQSIGFKEFHEYLLLSEEDRNTEKGKQLFNEGVEDLKRVTRKYARKQIRWLKNRLLKRSADNVPPVYGLNATHVADWDRLVLEPAVHVIQAMIKDERPDIAPIPPLDEPKNKHVFKTCDICDGIILTTEKDFKMHMSGRRHKKNLARKKAAESVISEIQTKKENIADESSLPVKS
ncbi:hypothetical protein Ahia01_000633400 [Argonauta hians]